MLRVKASSLCFPCILRTYRAPWVVCAVSRGGVECVKLFFSSSVKASPGRCKIHSVLPRLAGKADPHVLFPSRLSAPGALFRVSGNTVLHPYSGSHSLSSGWPGNWLEMQVLRPSLRSMHYELWAQDVAICVCVCFTVAKYAKHKIYRPNRS